MSRGHYRRVYESLIGHPRFTPLSPFARAMWLALKAKLGPGGIGPVYDDQLMDWTGIKSRNVLQDARNELLDYKWLEVEGRIHWLIGGLANEKARKEPNTIIAIQRTLDDMRGEIIARYREYYAKYLTPEAKPTGKATGKASAKPTAKASLSSSSSSSSRKRISNGGGGPRTPAHAGKAPPAVFNDLRDYLGDHGHIADEARALWGTRWISPVWTRYGPQGRDTEDFGRFREHDEQAAILASALRDLVEEGEQRFPKGSLQGFIQKAAHMFLKRSPRTADGVEYRDSAGAYQPYEDDTTEPAKRMTKAEMKAIKAHEHRDINPVSKTNSATLPAIPPAADPDKQAANEAERKRQLAMAAAALTEEARK